MSKEMVVHPSHYNTKGRKECWDEMEEIFGMRSTAMFDIITAYKYYYRMGRKEDNPEEQDKAKARMYLDHAEKLIQMITEYTYHYDTGVSQLISFKQKVEDLLNEQD